MDITQEYDNVCSWAAMLTINAVNIHGVIEPADDALFKQIIANPNHVLAYLLPDKTDTHYYFRPRHHYTDNFYGLPKHSKLYDSNFIVCMLYKQSYRHFYHFRIVCDAFCHPLLNEYGILWMDGC